MPPFQLPKDVSLIIVPESELPTELTSGVISRPLYGETNVYYFQDRDGDQILPSLPDDYFGLYISYYEDGVLRHLGHCERGKPHATLDVFPPQELAQHSSGHAGEVFHQGLVSRFGPWHEADTGRPTKQPFDSWVQEKIDSLYRWYVKRKKSLAKSARRRL